MTARAATWTTAVVMAGLMTAACSAGGDRVLDDLAADPMAATGRPGAVTTVASDQPTETGGLLSKSAPARVLRSYRPVGTTPEAFAADLRDRATGAGWRFDSPTAPTARKQFGFGPGLLELHVNEYLAPPEVVLTLEPAGTPG